MLLRTATTAAPAAPAVLGPDAARTSLSWRRQSHVHAVAVTSAAAFWAACAVVVSVATFAGSWLLADGHHSPDATSALAVTAYLVTAGLLGQLIARATHRAARAEVEARRLAREQAALRRVATAVGAEVGPEGVFAAVTREVGELLALDVAALLRFENDGTVTVAGSWSRVGPRPPVGARWELTVQAVALADHGTERTGRIEEVDRQGWPLHTWLRDAGSRSFITSPVSVHGRTWGLMVGGSMAADPLPPGTKPTLDELSNLAATAIADAQSRHELAASRARMMTSTHQARQRIERDLHDGIQQRLVSLALDVRQVEALAGSVHQDLRERLSELRVGLVSAVEEVREVARGIHPSVLTEGGLKPALAMLARRSPVPVELTVHGRDRVPEPVEVCVYYVVSEALTNAAKHAHATFVSVELQLDEAAAHLVVQDDGVGGADAHAGSGLIGLRDRLEALDGAIEMRSPAGRGTRLEVSVPWVPETWSLASRSGCAEARSTPGPGDAPRVSVGELTARAELEEAGALR